MAGPRRILLSPPDVGAVERQLLLDTFDSGWIAPAGPELAAFEGELAELTGRAHAVVLSSGTAALHLALLGVGVQAGDDVLVSDLTFGASAFAATYVGARPCFVDCDPLTWQIDSDLLADELARRANRGRLPAAVVAVDVYGAMADGRALAEVCARYEVPLVEDAAEALGARRDGVPGGGYGRCAVLSFNGNKIVTTGGGGALVSDDAELVDRARYRSTQARQPVPWYEHRDIGFNYRMGSLNAAVGRGQLRTLGERIAWRAHLRQAYEHGLRSIDRVRFQQPGTDSRPNHWLTTVAIDGADPDRIVAHLEANGVESRHGFKPMSMQPVFAGAPTIGRGVGAQLFATSVSLPTGRHVAEADVARICDLVGQACAPPA